MKYLIIILIFFVSAGIIMQRLGALDI